MNIHYCKSLNFGDALTPYLAEKITGKKPVFCEANTNDLKYMITGSILNWPVKNAVVWGCGLANSNDPVTIDDIRMTRGPISADIARKNGKRVPHIYGDPALLLPLYYTNSVKKTYEFGIFPHWSEYKAIKEQINTKEILVIDAMGKIETVIDQINSCCKLFSSSLHGIITAHAYDIPCAWFEYSRNIGGDGTKFYDYYASIGVNNPECMPFDIVKFKEKTLKIQNTSKILEAEMLNECPFLR